jgi:methyl-accepting chemotaxis protein
MFKSLPLATKLALGFGSLVVIVGILGGLAISAMWSAKASATAMAEADVPQVAMSNEVERDSLKTMYNMRGYGFTGEQQYLDSGQKSLAEVKADVAKAADLARQQSLDELGKEAQGAAAKVAEYDQLVTQTIALMKGMEEDRAVLGESAKKFMENCVAFATDQHKAMVREIQDAVEAPKLAERHQKIQLINDVITLGSDIRVGAWKAQTLRDPKMLEEDMQKFAAMDKLFEDIRPLTHLEANLKELDEAKAAAHGYETALKKLHDDWVISQEVAAKRGATGDAVLAAAQKASEIGIEGVTNKSSKAAESLARSCSILACGLGGAVLIAIILAYFITLSITKPLKNTFKGLKSCSTAELDETAATFNRIIDSMADGVAQVNDAAAQVSSASQQLAEGASEQASALEETSSALEQMAAMARNNAATSKEANDLATQSHKAAAEGEKTMIGINEASDKISKIIKVIEEIAFQTNLLALNAAVEAARAGEHGKGFAVVAEEVRNLAQRAAGAAKETTALIDESVNKSREGKQAIQTIVGGVARVTELINGISKASEEQAQGVEQVNAAVSQMDQVTQQNASSAEESASAAEELTAQASATKGFVDELVVLVRGANAHTTSGPRATSVPNLNAARTRVALPAARLAKPPKRHAAGASGTASSGAGTAEVFSTVGNEASEF